MFKLVLSDTSIIKESFESISKIVDEVVCEVDEDGFRLSAMDRSHICFCFLDLKASTFDEYTCDVPEKICIDTTDFMKILKRGKKSDILSLSNDEFNNLIIGMSGDADREFKLKLIDISYESPVPPAIEFPASVSVSSGVVKDAIVDMEVFSDKLYFIVDEESLIIDAEGEFGDANFQFLHGETNIQGEHKSCFNISKLKEIFAASKFSEVVEISVGTNKPISFKFELITGDGELKYLLAPRLEQEYED